MDRFSYAVSRKEKCDIVVGTDILRTALSDALRAHGIARVYLVADAITRKTVESLIEAIPVPLVRNPLYVEGGEGAKTLAHVEEALSQLAGAGVTRKDGIVVVGGGSVLDAWGFVAAIFKRGVPAFYVPTTLLAMVDAAIGGKTAVNLGEAKNQVGVIRNPSAIIMDRVFLKTLPEAHVYAGLGEVVKTALLAGGRLLDEVAAYLRSFDGTAEPSEQIVLETARYKASIVEEDPYEERGLRDILNFGHTAGHAIEGALEGSVPHGICVAHGMRVEQRLAWAQGLCSENVFDLVVRLTEPIVGKYPLESWSGKRARTLLRADKKKMDARTIRFVFIEEPGKPALSDVEEDQFGEFLEEYCGEQRG